MSGIRSVIVNELADLEAAARDLRGLVPECGDYRLLARLLLSLENFNVQISEMNERVARQSELLSQQAEQREVPMPETPRPASEADNDKKTNSPIRGARRL